MKEQPVIQFENVSKMFTFSKEKTQTFLETLISPFRKSPVKEPIRHLWALDDVSFDIYPGQSVGIVGRNGSGKSTALKLVTRIIKPTEGRIFVNGKVSALLELGAGFHPDLTGRENIYLNASLLGLSRRDVNVHFDDIVAFSELGEFINMPVKHYSSGMYMRLGFSVAIHIQPDILIVDEILAVGDQAFQTKCLDRIHQMKAQGVTFIMVSHNLNIVRRMCDHLIWLENGKLQQAGLVDEVAELYQAYTYQNESDQLEQDDAAASVKRDSGSVVEITAVRILNKDGKEEKNFNTGEQLVVEMTYFAHKPIPNPQFGLAIHRHDGLHINGPNTRIAGLDMGLVEGAGVVRYCIPELPLTPARYRVTTAVHDSRYNIVYDVHHQAYSFRVVADGAEEIYGAFEIPAVWDWAPDE
jgi:lipopolysaccharide transport system ATP-binding protein